MPAIPSHALPTNGATVAKRARVGRPRKDEESAIGTRQELLEATIAYVGQHGFSGLSLRGLASAIGTSHRILIYHFESKALLLAAVVEAIEARFSAKLIELGERADLPPADQIRQIWEELTTPERLVYGKLYVEMFAQEMTGRGSGLFATLDKHWVSALTRVARGAGRSAAAAKIEGRLGLGILRGLYFDLLANGDPKGVSQAWDNYLSRYEPGKAGGRKEAGGRHFRAAPGGGGSVGAVAPISENPCRASPSSNLRRPPPGR